MCSGTTTVVMIVKSDLQCRYCRDTGMVREENGHGGLVATKCIYCHAFDRRGLGGDYDLEPRLPPLFGGSA